MSEKEIAKKNVENWNFTKPDDDDLWRLNVWFNKCEEHLASCKRFLRFLNEIDENYALGIIENKAFKDDVEILLKKIKDLNQAIKIYNEVGLK